MTEHHHAQLAVLEALAAAGRAEVDAVIVVADEQQRRIDAAGLLIIDGERQPAVIEPGQRPRRGDQHRQPLVAAEPPALHVAVDDHQRIEADGAVVDEDAPAHLTKVDAALAAGGDDLGRFLEIEWNAEIAREMVERAERQDAERRLGAGERRGGRGDRAVAAADDQQWVAALGDGAGAHLALAAVDQLDLGADTGGSERRADLLVNRGVRRRRAAAAVDQYAPHGRLTAGRAIHFPLA